MRRLQARKGGRARGTTAGLAAALLLATMPAAAQPTHHHRLAHAARRAHRAAAAAADPRPWGTAVYGTSLPFVEGTCVDPYDPDPIGGPDRVGEGGPAGYGPQCRAQAGDIPGTTVR